MTIIGLAIVIAFIVFSTAKLKWHPFLVLVLAAFLTAFFYGMPLPRIADTVGTGFGSILGSIGLVIVFGTIIGLVMERTGAAVVMAESVIKVLGERFPTLTMSVIGAIVSIPVFCDSGYVILNSLKETLAKRLKVSSIAMSVALATGLYATHNFVPPTPGPIAAAGNLGLADNLGLVIVMGLVVSVPACLAGWLWANRFVHEQPQGEGAAGQVSTAGSVNAADREASSPADAVAATRYADADDTDGAADRTRYGQMPSPLMAFMPIVLPIALICIGSVAAFPSRPLGSGLLFTVAAFPGQAAVRAADRFPVLAAADPG